MGRIFKRNSVWIAVWIVLVLAAPVSASAAEELTRAEYVERIEPICKANSEANSRILSGVRRQVKRGRLVPAGKRFVRAARAFRKAISQLSAVPRPGADAAKLTKWIKYLRLEKSYLQRIGQALKKEKKGRAQQLAVRLNRTNNLANNTVISFGFKHCRIDSSRFL